MRRGNKKVWAVTLAAALTAGLAGCGGQPEGREAAGSAGASGSSGGTSSSAPVSAESSAEGSGEAKELKVIRILGGDYSSTDDYGNTVCLSDWVNGDSKIWEKLTQDLAGYGVKLELDLIPLDQIDTVVQTQIVAGLDYDMVNITSVDNKTRMNLIQQGKIVPVNDIWDNYSDGTAKAYYNEGWGSVVANLNVMEDGNRYWLTGSTLGDYKGDARGSLIGAMIRYDWLQKLDLKMPETTEELYETLRAFQEKDANGNGQPDEVATVSLDSFETGIAQMFGLGTTVCYVDYETGKVTSNWYQDGIKDYILFMRRLCEEGLLDTSGQGSVKKSENKVSLIKSYWIATWDEAAVIVPEGEHAPQYVGVICDAGNGLVPLVDTQSGVQKNGYDFAITDRADKEAVGRLLDYLASEEYATLTEFGIEGYSYEVVDGVMKELSSDISEVQIMKSLGALWINNGILPRAEVVDREQELIACVEAGRDMGWPEGYEEKARIIRDVYDHPEKYHFAVKQTDLELAVATVKETEALADINADFKTYYKELLTKLILGEASMDDWDTYLEEMRELGLDELIEITQARYDRAHK